MSNIESEINEKTRNIHTWEKDLERVHKEIDRLEAQVSKIRVEYGKKMDDLKRKFEDDTSRLTEEEDRKVADFTANIEREGAAKEEIEGAIATAKADLSKLQRDIQETMKKNNWN